MRDTCSICGKDKTVVLLRDNITFICKGCFDSHAWSKLKEIIGEQNGQETKETNRKEVKSRR
jgi:hypothetical protein